MVNLIFVIADKERNKQTKKQFTNIQYMNHKKD